MKSFVVVTLVTNNTYVDMVICIGRNWIEFCHGRGLENRSQFFPNTYWLLPLIDLYFFSFFAFKFLMILFVRHAVIFSLWVH